MSVCLQRRNYVLITDNIHNTVCLQRRNYVLITDNIILYVCNVETMS